MNRSHVHRRAVLCSAAAAVVLLAAAIWLSQTWSLSSYAIVLRSLGAHETGLVLGTPREIRSDEWSILTPFLQATVNNDFRRHNETSFYGEDLRMILSLPVADWGLAFKPDQWLYPLANPAYAFSFQHLVYIVAFLLGYGLFFARLGIPGGTSALLALVLFFTAFVQFWWTTFAPNLAYFPWLLLALGIRVTAIRGIALLWIAVVWMLGYFYPPMFMALSLVAAVVYWSVYYPERGLRGAMVDATVALVACAIVVFYLQDMFAATWNTIYPGQRRSRGGLVSLAMQVQHLWPTAFLDHYESAIHGLNICEASVVGSYYFLLAACFVDWRGFRVSQLPPATRRMFVPATVVWALLIAWQSVRIPAAIGGLILFDRIPPQRTLFASGFLALVALALVVNTRSVRFTLPRLALFCAIAVAGWWLAKHGGVLLKAVEPADALVVPVAIVACVIGAAYPARGHVVLTASAGLLGLAAFAPFNPLQSAWPIFNREATPVTRALDAEQARNAKGVLVVNPANAPINAWVEGAIPNGLGYRSASHVLLAPELELWARLLPEMEPAAREKIFNRAANIVVRDIASPQLMAINIAAVPPRIFGGEPQPWVSIAPLETIHWRMRGGHVATRHVEGRRLTIAGWAPWQWLAPGQTLTVYSPSPLTVISARRYEWADVAAVMHDPSLRYSGYVVEVEPADGEPVPDNVVICLVARDARTGLSALIEPGAPACAAAGH